MKNLFLLITLCSINYISIGQQFNLSHDHTNLMVIDLEKSADFYENVLQLEEVETPWKQKDILRFYSIGDGMQLHVFKADKNDIAIHKSRHVAFNVADFDEYLKFLKEKGVIYANFSGDSTEPQLRPDGVRQIYFQDPDGNWFEVNDAGHIKEK